MPNSYFTEIKNHLSKTVGAFTDLKETAIISKFNMSACLKKLEYFLEGTAGSISERDIIDCNHEKVMTTYFKLGDGQRYPILDVLRMWILEEDIFVKILDCFDLRPIIFAKDASNLMCTKLRFRIIVNLFHHYEGLQFLVNQAADIFHFINGCSIADFAEELGLLAKKYTSCINGSCELSENIFPVFKAIYLKIVDLKGRKTC